MGPMPMTLNDLDGQFCFFQPFELPILEMYSAYDS